MAFLKGLTTTFIPAASLISIGYITSLGEGNITFLYAFASLALLYSCGTFFHNVFSKKGTKASAQGAFSGSLLTAGLTGTTLFFTPT